AERLKETYEGFTVGEVAAREGKHEIDAFLDVAVAGQLRVGFATKMLETPAGVDEGDRHLPGGAARRERRRCAHEARHHGPVPHGDARLRGARARDHEPRGGPLAALLLPRDGGRPEGPRPPR